MQFFPHTTALATLLISTVLIPTSLLSSALVSSARADSITVSAAISLKESLTQAAADYHAASGNVVSLNFGASGQLEAQIAQGAPVDVFISAGVKEMDQLAAANLIAPDTRHDICGNTLVLIVPADAKFVPDSFNALTDPRIQKVAIGQPTSVPAGQYARQVLANLKLTDALAPRLVFGENVRQVLDYVTRGEVDAGVVYATDAAAAGPKVRLAAVAPESSHQPIVYPAAVIKATPNPAASRHFMDYLTSAAAAKILIAHGFSVNKPAENAAPAVLHTGGNALKAADWTLAQLQTQLSADIKPIPYTSRGAQHTFDCVPLTSILKIAGAPADFTMQPGTLPKIKNPQMRQFVTISGSDGYTVVFSLAEILPMVGNRAVWVALDEDGKPLPDADGPLRLIVPDDKMPSRSVHEVTSIELTQVDSIQWESPATHPTNP